MSMPTTNEQATPRWTKGPWKVSEDTPFEIEQPDGVMIGMAYGPDDFPCVDDDEGKYEDLILECEANARLIAAAPDLLAAAKAALDWMRGKRGGPTEKMTPDEVLAQLETAIARAEHPEEK